MAWSEKHKLIITNMEYKGMKWNEPTWNKWTKEGRKERMNESMDGWMNEWTETRNKYICGEINNQTDQENTQDIQTQWLTANINKN